MSRALVTLATGEEHQQLLEISEPSMRRYAGRHGYDFLAADLECDRPGSWHKIPILKAALKEYDEVLWVDADIVIVDPSKPVPCPDDCWQALVRHQTGDGDVPNCGMWLVRKPMVEFLDMVWANTARLNSGWWEQAALMDLMGYQHDHRPAYVSNPTLLYERTHFLSNEWNFHKWDTPAPTHVRFAHGTMFEDRAGTMETWAKTGVPPCAPTRCRHRYPIKNCLCESYFAERAA